MLSVSLTFAGAFALLNLWLAFRVTKLRVIGKVMMGDGGNPLLLSRSRAHANFIEYTPFVLILIVLLELAGAPRTWLWGIGIVYVLARISHAFGMDRPAPNPMRAGGAMITWAVLLGLAIWGLVLASHAPAPQVGIHYL